MHRSPAADKGHRPIGFAVEGLRPAPYATCNCGIRVQAARRNRLKTGAQNNRPGRAPKPIEPELNFSQLTGKRTTRPASLKRRGQRTRVTILANSGVDPLVTFRRQLSILLFISVYHGIQFFEST